MVNNHVWKYAVVASATTIAALASLLYAKRWKTVDKTEEELCSYELLIGNTPLVELRTASLLYGCRILVKVRPACPMLFMYCFISAHGPYLICIYTPLLTRATIPYITDGVYESRWNRKGSCFHVYVAGGGEVRSTVERGICLRGDIWKVRKCVHI